MKIYKQIYFLLLLVIAPLWLLACNSHGNRSKADGSAKEETIGEKEGNFLGTEDTEHSKIMDSNCLPVWQGCLVTITS